MISIGMKRVRLSSPKKLKSKCQKQLSNFTIWVQRLWIKQLKMISFLNYLISMKTYGLLLERAGVRSKQTFKEGLTLHGMESILPKCSNTTPTLLPFSWNLVTYKKSGLLIQCTIHHFTNQIIFKAPWINQYYR